MNNFLDIDSNKPIDISLQKFSTIFIGIITVLFLVNFALLFNPILGLIKKDGGVFYTFSEHKFFAIYLCGKMLAYALILAYKRMGIFIYAIVQFLGCLYFLGSQEEFKEIDNLFLFVIVACFTLLFPAILSLVYACIMFVILGFVLLIPNKQRTTAALLLKKVNKYF